MHGFKVRAPKLSSQSTSTVHRYNSYEVKARGSQDAKLKGQFDQSTVSKRLILFFSKENKWATAILKKINTTNQGNKNSTFNQLFDNRMAITKKD